MEAVTDDLFPINGSDEFAQKCRWYAWAPSSGDSVMLKDQSASSQDLSTKFRSEATLCGAVLTFARAAAALRKGSKGRHMGDELPCLLQGRAKGAVTEPSIVKPRRPKSSRRRHVLEDPERVQTEPPD